MSAKYSIGQMNELANSCHKAGLTNKMLKSLNARRMREVRLWQQGYLKIQKVEHLIDCSVTPRVHKEVRLISHKKTSVLNLQPDTIEWFSVNQLTMGTGYVPEAEPPDGYRFLNANVLDYLEDNPGLIHPEWSALCEGPLGITILAFVGTRYMRLEKKAPHHDEELIRYLDGRGGLYKSIDLPLWAVVACAREEAFVA